MKKILLFALTAMLCIGGASAKIKYVTANLNLRTSPSIKSKILLTIPKGTSIEIDDCDCLWVPVYYKGNVGYVCTKYIAEKRPVARPQSSIRHYTNTYGNRVQSPTHYSSQPTGATALCRDGSYSFSQSRRGTCSHHGGVARWL